MYFSLRHIGTGNLNTDRLKLRRFEQTDVNSVFYNWATDEDVAKYNMWKVNSSIAETSLIINDWCESYKRDSYYNWAILFRETNEVIGSISASSISNFFCTCNVGYTISKKYWNKGIATEALKEVISFLSNEVGMKKIYAYHHFENIASGKVLKKCGMQFVVRKNKFLMEKKMFALCDFYFYEP